MKEYNAVISGTTITNDAHGMLSIVIQLDFGDSSTQGFGGHALYSEAWKDKGPNATGLFMWRVMEVAEVRYWHELKGKTVRARKKDQWADIEAIGHILKDNWFCPKKEFAEL